MNVIIHSGVFLLLVQHYYSSNVLFQMSIHSVIVLFSDWIQPDLSHSQQYIWESSVHYHIFQRILQKCNRVTTLQQHGSNTYWDTHVKLYNDWANHFASSRAVHFCRCKRWLCLQHVTQITKLRKPGAYRFCDVTSFRFHSIILSLYYLWSVHACVCTYTCM